MRIYVTNHIHVYTMDLTHELIFKPTHPSGSLV